MSGEITDVPIEQRKRRPIPIFEDRFVQSNQGSFDKPYIDLSKSYLRKNILAEIGNNLNELIDIKTGGKSIDNNQLYSKPVVFEEKKVEKIEKPIEKLIETPEIMTFSDELKKSDTNTNINKSDAKIGIPTINSINKDATKEIIKETIKETNYNKEKDSKQNIKQDVKIENKPIEIKKKIIKRKVNYMGEDDNVNIPPELRRSMRKAEFKEYQDEEEINKKIRESVDLASHNKNEIETLKLSVKENSLNIKKDLDSKFVNLDSKFEIVDNKFGQLDSKFVGKFDGISKKLEETCTGIECLKKDFKKQELVECEDCKQQSVPIRASFCSNCGAKIRKWSNDDGTPLTDWIPTWKKLEK